MSLKDKITILITDLFQENGHWSLSKVTSGAITIACIVWVSYVVTKNRNLSSATVDLEGIAFLLGGGAAHYGIGKWLGKKNSGDDSQVTGDKG